jgi:hypothetical protein
MQLVGNSVQTRLRALCPDIVQNCSMLRLRCWRLRLAQVFHCHGMLLPRSDGMSQFLVDFVYTY